MRTETSPRRALPAASRGIDVVAALLMAVGFGLVVLGILQIGGLAALGCGFLVVFVASIPLILDAGQREEAFNDELHRLLDEG